MIKEVWDNFEREQNKKAANIQSGALNVIQEDWRTTVQLREFRLC